MTNPVEAQISRLFTEGRTHIAWLDRPVDAALLRRVYELARMGPTGGNSQPMRVVLAASGAAKEKLKPALNPQNVDKTMSAPATAIIAYDVAFFEKMPKLFPARPDLRDMLATRPPDVRDKLARDSALLQAGYFILAARMLGLDCGPIGGFEPEKVDAAFFPDGRWRSILLINLGYGDPTKLHPRNPRLDFDEACRFE